MSICLASYLGFEFFTSVHILYSEAIETYANNVRMSLFCTRLLRNVFGPLKRAYNWIMTHHTWIKMKVKVVFLKVCCLSLLTFLKIGWNIFKGTFYKDASKYSNFKLNVSDVWWSTSVILIETILNFNWFRKNNFLPFQIDNLM